MRAGQPIKASAINVKLFENGDAPRPGREQRGLGGDHVVVGEAAAREALTNECDRAFGLGQGFLGNATRFERPRREEHLKPRDLAFPFLPERRHIRLGGDAFEPGARDSPLVAIVATEGNGPADHQAEVLSFPEMSDADADCGIRRGARLFDPDPGPGNVALCGQNGKIDFRDRTGDFTRGTGVLKIDRVKREVGGSDPEPAKRCPSEARLDPRLVKIDLGLCQFGFGAGPCEQGITRHVHAPLHLRLEAFGQIQAFAGDFKFGLGGEGVGPCTLHLLEPVQSPDGVLGLNHRRFASGKSDTCRLVTAPLEALLIGQCCLSPVDEAASAEPRQVFDGQAQCRIGSNVGLAHSGIAGASAGFAAGKGGIHLGGTGQRAFQG